MGRIIDCILGAAFLAYPISDGFAADQNQPIKAGDQLAAVLDDFRPTVAQYGVVPVVVSQGQAVGDIISSGWSLVATADDCFRPLNLRTGPATLPSITGHTSDALKAGLGLSSIGSASGALETDRTFEISFKDVTFTTVSSINLAKSLKRQVPECADVASFLENVGTQRTFSYQGTDDPPIVIGTVFEATRVFKIQSFNDADAQATVSLLTSLLQKVGIGAVKADVNAAKKDGIDVETQSEKRVVVAFHSDLYL